MILFMNTSKPTIPKLKYTGDEEVKKMMSLRLPEELVNRLKEIASENGWSLTMLIQMVLDHYAQQEDNKK